MEVETARQGGHVLCAGSRYARNETAAILEKVLLDLGAYVREARAAWGYRKVVLAGWSAGGSLAMSYQAQAERPTLTRTAAGDPVSLAGLPPADSVVFHAAATSRARMLAEMIDPSPYSETDPTRRDPSLDLYARGDGPAPPYDPVFLARYREGQVARMRRITDWVKATLAELEASGGVERDRAFVVHRTLADPHFLDPGIDANDRRPNGCWLGDPEAVNAGPAGLARYSTLRAWLSQWSIDDTNIDAVRSAEVSAAPLLVLENAADDCVPPAHLRAVHSASASADKTYAVIEGATHYCAGQPDRLRQAVELTRAWLVERDLLEADPGGGTVARHRDRSSGEA
jgi:pimeloyl-ACP methyl ester carboxylesterase